MIMPGGLTGDELAAELKRRKPGLKVIYASGYTSAFVGRDFGQDNFAFLPKPYQPQPVAQLIRTTLDEKDCVQPDSANGSPALTAVPV